MQETTSSPRTSIPQTPADYFDAIWRRRWVILGVFVLVLALTAFVTARTEPSYAASAMLLVQPENQSDILTTGNALARINLNGSDVANHVGVLQSRGLAQKVAALLDSEKLAALAGAAGNQGQPDFAARAHYSVDVRQVQQTNMIRIQAAAPVPALAMAVANAYVETYQQYNLEQKRTDVTAVRQFVENQLEVIGARLDSGERGLQAFKELYGIVDVNARTQALIEQQATLAAADNQSQTEVQGLEAEIAHIRTRIAQDSPKVGTRLNNISSPLVANLKANLDQLEVEKANLFIQGFPEQSPRIQNLARQIADVRQQLAAESQKLVTQDNLLDPVSGMRSLYESELRAETDLEAARARAGTLSAARGRNDAALSRLPLAERKFVRLSRDVEADRQVYSLLSRRYEEARIQEVGRTSDVQVVDLAQGAGKVRPNVRSNLTLGLVLALALAFGVGLGVEYLDTSVQSSRDLERLGYSVLASIPKLSTNGRRRTRPGPGRVADTSSHLISLVEPESSGAEAFRMFCTSLKFAGLDKPFRTILITSPGPSEGKSTVAVNLATILAQAGHRTLLLDADLRRPMLHRVFRHGQKPGFSDMILLGSPSTDAVFATEIDKLFCLPSGQLPPSPALVLDSAAARELLQWLSHEFEYVIIDAPPVLLAADTAIIAAWADTTVLVVRAGKTTTEGIEYAQQTIAQSGARVSGFVVNWIKHSVRHSRDYYYYRYYDHYHDSRRHHENRPRSWLTGRHARRHETTTGEPADPTARVDERYP
jgi:tyrosine-protein kinase Etk/Wzc